MIQNIILLNKVKYFTGIYGYSVKCVFDSSKENRTATHTNQLVSLKDIPLPVTFGVYILLSP